MRVSFEEVILVSSPVPTSFDHCRRPCVARRIGRHRLDLRHLPHKYQCSSAAVSSPCIASRSSSLPRPASTSEVTRQPTPFLSPVHHISTAERLPIETMLASSTGHSPPSGAADSTAPRRPRRSSLANHTAHQREKAKSSSSHPQDGRHKSVSSTAGAGYIGAAGDPSRTVRPTMKSRAYSAPLINHSHFRDSEDESEESDDAGEEALRAEMGDEITGDPFFQRYNFSTSNSQAVEGVGTIEEDDSSDTEGPKSPLKSNARPRPDSVAEPLASPISPMGSRSFAFEVGRELPCADGSEMGTD